MFSVVILLLATFYPRAEELLNIEVLRLDWQNIVRIDNLDTFTYVRELYLQHNRIEVIEELDSLSNLEFLALGSNRIRRLENIRHLTKVALFSRQSTINSVIFRPPTM